MPFAGLPRSGPMPSFADLTNWTTPNDPANQTPLTPLQPRPAPTGSHLFLYHDMYGGYIPDGDLFPQGTACDDFYNFNFWQYTDIFSYFTHYWLAVPPPAWTNAAHRNGVPMLGNLTPPYNDDGSFIQPMLDDPDLYVKQLVSMCQYYGFDGWAFNFETNLLPPRTTNAQKLASFLGQLTTALHAAIPGSKVIWYDSVTASGFLGWQGELNSQNEIFFDNCDGIFLDYRWQYVDPTLSTSAKNAGARALDVYAGIDVFSNQYNTYEALQIAKTAGVSGGLFAFSWTYQQQTDADPYPQREQQLWIGDPVTYPNLTQCIGAVIDERAVPTTLPFLSNFNTGAGRQFFIGGNRVSAVGTEGGDIHSGNMSHQDPLPTWRYQISWGSTTAFSASPSYDNAFDGPTSLLIQSVSTTAGAFSVFDLFLAAITIPNPCTLGFSYAATSEAPLPDMMLIVRYANDTEQILEPISGNANGWQSVTFDLSAFAGQVINKLQLKVAIPSTASSAAVYAGELKLLNAGSQPFYPNAVTNLAASDVVLTTSGIGNQLASFDLSWDLNAGDDVHSYTLWNVWPNGSGGFSYGYIGRAFTNAYTLENVPFGGATSVTIGVQPRNHSGYSQPLADMATVSVSTTMTAAPRIPIARQIEERTQAQIARLENDRARSRARV